MSHNRRSNKNSQKAGPNLSYMEYLYDPDESAISDDYKMPPELEAELLDNSLTMKRRLKRIAQRVENRFR